MEFPEGELSVMITDDKEMTGYNEKYLGRKGPTNVIAFPMREGEFSGITPYLLGDVLISADTALKESKEAGISFDERINELIIHGILHLFGYDHENSEEEAEKMDKKTKELMMLLKKEPETGNEFEIS